MPFPTEVARNAAASWPCAKTTTGRADKAALDAVRMAFEIELGGRAFYQRAAAESSDDELRALFGRFAVMEGEHMETLSRRYHVECPAVAGFRVELAAIFAEVEHRPQEPDNLFRVAIALEKRAAGFFATRVRRRPAGSAEQRLYLELGAEEREHAACWRPNSALARAQAGPVHRRRRRPIPTH